MITKLRSLYSKDRRSGSLKKPYIYFFLELIIMMEVIYVLYKINNLTIYVSIPATFLYIYFNGIKRFETVIERAKHYKEKEDKEDNS